MTCRFKDRKNAGEYCAGCARSSILGCNLETVRQGTVMIIPFRRYKAASA